MIAGPLHLIRENGETSLFFGAQRRIARSVDPEYAPTLVAAPGLVIAAETVARELDRLAQGVYFDADALRWCASTLRRALPKGCT